LALFFHKVDLRLKYVKELKKMASEINCTPLSGRALEEFVIAYCDKRQRKISAEAVQVLLERVGTDLSFITLELDKLLNFVGDGGSISPDAIGQITSFAPGEIRQGAVFTLVDAIAAKDRAIALQILRKLIDAGEVPMRILPLIERQSRLLLAAKTRGSGSFEDTAKTMGESSVYPLKKVSRYATKFTVDELLAGFAEIIWADREMKLGGNGEYILEQLIASLCP